MKKIYQLLLPLNVKVLIYCCVLKPLYSMPIRASKRKARHRSAQSVDDSTSTSFQRLDREKSSLTEEQISETTKQIEKQIARKVKDEIQRTENTIVKSLRFQSENSLHGNITSMSAETVLGLKDVSPDQFESSGLESGQENIAPENTFTDAFLQVPDTRWCDNLDQKSNSDERSIRTDDKFSSNF